MNYQIITHQHIFESETYFWQCHASTITFLPSGGLAVCWFAGKYEKSPDVAIWFSKNLNGTWSKPVKIAWQENTPCWNPVLLTKEGVLTLFYKVGNEITKWKTMVKKSFDEGETWTLEKELIQGDEGGRGPVKNKCIWLQNGNLLAPASIETNDAWFCFVDISTDGGETWTKSASVQLEKESLFGMGLIQPTLWQDQNGIVHMLMRSSESAIFIAHSNDNGRTFSKAKRTQLPNNNCGIDVAQMEDGRLILIYNPIAGNWAARSPIAFSLSHDNGRTWSKPQILDYVPCDTNMEQAEFSYPAIIAKGNEIFITYTWKRRTIAYWQIRFPYIQEEKGLKNGCYVTMITPFTPENTIDYQALDPLIDWYIANGVDGLFAVCQSSEMFFLSLEERVALANYVVKRASDRVSVITGGHISEQLEEQIEEIKQLTKTGADAVVLTTNRLALQQEGDDIWKQNVKVILDAIPDVSFGLYECPYPYKRLLSPDLLRWCADTGRFSFIKDTSCDINDIEAKLTAIKGKNLKLYNANTATLLESLRLGASGFCGVMANFHPRLYVWLMKNWKDNPQYALFVQRFATVASLIERQLYPINAKYALSLCGLPIDKATRSKDVSLWNHLYEIETEAMQMAYEDFMRMVLSSAQ